MSPSAIVYASATGFTRRYADLLSERTGLPCFALGAVPGPDRARRFSIWAGCAQVGSKASERPGPATRCRRCAPSA